MSDIWDDPLPSYFDDGERFGTGPEMIAEIKRLRRQLGLPEGRCKTCRGTGKINPADFVIIDCPDCVKSN